MKTADDIKIRWPRLHEPAKPSKTTKTAKNEELAARDLPDAARLLRALLAGEERGPCRDMLLLNAAMAIVAAGLATDAASGLEAAAGAIDSGAAARTLACLREASRS